MKPPKPIPQSLLDEVVYDEESPSCLYWVRTGSGRTSRVAGGIQPRKGYYVVSYNRCHTTGGGYYYVHRVIWAVHYGLNVPSQLDHINQNKLDNRITNLRDGTGHNPANRKNWTNNKYKGVREVRPGRYRMSCGKHLEGGVEKLYDTEIEAALAYNEAALRLYGEFAYLNIIN